MLFSQTLSKVIENNMSRDNKKGESDDLCSRVLCSLLQQTKVNTTFHTFQLF